MEDSSSLNPDIHSCVPKDSTIENVSTAEKESITENVSTIENISTAEKESIAETDSTIETNSTTEKNSTTEQDSSMNPFLETLQQQETNPAFIGPSQQNETDNKLSIEDEENIAYLKKNFPTVSDQSLWDIYLVNDSDLYAALDMLILFEFDPVRLPVSPLSSEVGDLKRVSNTESSIERPRDKPDTGEPSTSSSNFRCR